MDLLNIIRNGVVAGENQMRTGVHDAPFFNLLQGKHQATAHGTATDANTVSQIQSLVIFLKIEGQYRFAFPNGHIACLEQIQIITRGPFKGKLDFLRAPPSSINQLMSPVF